MGWRLRVVDTTNILVLYMIKETWDSISKSVSYDRSYSYITYLINIVKSSFFSMWDSQHCSLVLIESVAILHPHARSIIVYMYFYWRKFIFISGQSQHGITIEVGLIHYTRQWWSKTGLGTGLLLTTWNFIMQHENEKQVEQLEKGALSGS